MRAIHVRRRLRLVILAICLSAASATNAGHELPFYPSHYPQEIQIDTLDPGTAATLLQQKSLHAYLGADPFDQRPRPAEVGAVESLGSYLVLTFRSGSKRFASREARCAMARQAWRAVSEAKEAFVLHPHPVTPFHEDYLHHLDVAASLRPASLARPAQGRAPAAPALRVGARGKVAERVARSLRRVARGGGDATVEEVPVEALMASRSTNLNGWLGPPWLKAGWFHAYLLLAGTIPDRARTEAVDEIYQRLTGAAAQGLEEQIALERKLVSVLTEGCERVVLGYTVRRSPFNAAFSEGIENLAHDSHGGFLSPAFLRTVKLKDFPWNGWLRLGIDSRPAAAWNPIGGFTDPAGRLIWYGVGDPGFLPAPYSASWIANRFASAVPTRGPTPGGLAVPRDALMPDPGSGAWRPVGDGKTAQAKVVYRVLSSAFHDETRMTVADAIYPYSFAYRWGVKAGRGGEGYDAFVGEATAGVRRALAGLKVLRVEKEAKDFGELRIMREIPVIEVYLRSAPLDALQAAALAPPWSSLPWHVVVLMEEAVKRGVAAFSAEEAKRRGIGWLDLVRDEKARDRLTALVAEFERQAYLPDALEGLVAPHDATLRWGALKRFAREHGHFLVTNGPYRLAKWSKASAVLQVWRDLSYPVGVGAFDRYVLPLRASMAKIESRDQGLRVSAEVERAERALRAYTIAREPFMGSAGDTLDRVPVACRYVVLAPDGDVLRAGTVPHADDGTFSVDLKGLRTGDYTVLIALYQNGNHVNADMRAVPFRVTP